MLSAMILVTVAGIAKDVSPVHPSKTRFPISVTEVGIGISVMPVLSRNASQPMQVTVSGITVDLQPVKSSFFSVIIIALQLPRES